MNASCCEEGAKRIVWKDKALGIRPGWYVIDWYSCIDHVDLYVCLCVFCGAKLPEKP